MTKARWDALDLDDRARLRDKKLKRQIRHQLYAYSPFYRRVLDELGLHSGDFGRIDDLAKMPLVDRSALSAGPEDFVLTPSRSQMQRWGGARQLTGSVMGVLLRGEVGFEKEMKHDYRPVHRLETNGAFGSPLRVRLSRRDVAVLGIQSNRTLEMAGITENDVLLNLLEPIAAGGFWPVWLGGVAMGAEQIAPGALEPEQAAVMAAKSSAAVIFCRAADALEIFDAVGEGRLPDLNTLVLAPEWVPPDLRLKVQESAGPGVRIIGTYGFAEGRALWSECAEGAGKPDAGYHTAGDFEVVESVSPRSGERVGEGEMGEIVFTGLDQRGTALARYRPGDVAVGGVTSSRCPHCGRAVERILGPVRRSSSLLDVQLGGEEPVAVDVEALAAAMVIPDLDTWRVEVSKSDGDFRGPDEIYVMFQPAAGQDPGTLAVRIDNVLKRDLGLKASQLVLADDIEGGVVDTRPIPAGPFLTPGDSSPRSRVRLWRQPPTP